MLQELKEKIRRKIGDLIFLKNKSGDYDFYHSQKTTKAKVSFLIFYLWHMKTMGQGRVIGRFTNFIPEFAGALIIFSFLGFTPTPKLIVMLVIVYMVLVMVIGWLYMYFDLDRAESLIGMRRDQFQRNLSKLLEKEKWDEIQ